MNTLDSKYQNLLQDILDNGIVKEDRTGTGTISVFGKQIRHKMSEGFPLLTTKKMHWNSIVTELLWFLRGDTNIKFLLDYDCHIWDGDAYKHYYEYASKLEEPDMNVHVEDIGESSIRVMTPNEFIKSIKTWPEFAEKWGYLGPIYGKQWRNWESVDTSQFWQEDWSSKDTDQIQNLINELKTNPDSRRLMVSAWNVGELNQMVLPPCHYGFQVYTRELSLNERIEYGDKNDMWKFGQTITPLHCDSLRIPTRAISLMWNQRSVDTFLGLPFNIASYGLLLEIIAREVNMVPDELIGNLGDVHLYSNHIEQAKEQISRTPYELPTITITERNWYLHEAIKKHLGEKTLDEKLKSYRPDCFELNNYQSHPKIKAPLSN
jgi:thymidylate synthase